MKHLYYLLADGICGMQDTCIHFMSVFRKKQTPSLTIENVLWCTNSTWMDRLIAYRQLDLWTFNR